MARLLEEQLRQALRTTAGAVAHVRVRSLTPFKTEPSARQPLQPLEDLYGGLALSGYYQVIALTLIIRKTVP